PPAPPTGPARWRRCCGRPAPRRCGVRRPRAALAALAVLAVVACNPDDVVHHVGWFATMRHQRSFKPYSRNLAPVPGTVPVTGVAPTADLKSADRLTNPRTRTSESLNRGKFVYETYCLVCHGEAGKGDGRRARRGGGLPVGARQRPRGPRVAGLSRQLHVLDRAGAGERRVRRDPEAREGSLVRRRDPLRRGCGAVPDRGVGAVPRPVL